MKCRRLTVYTNNVTFETSRPPLSLILQTRSAEEVAVQSVVSRFDYLTAFAINHSWICLKLPIDPQVVVGMKSLSQQ